MTDVAGDLKSATDAALLRIAELEDELEEANERITELEGALININWHRLADHVARFEISDALAMIAEASENDVSPGIVIARSVGFRPCAS